MGKKGKGKKQQQPKQEAVAEDIPQQQKITKESSRTSSPSIDLDKEASSEKAEKHLDKSHEKRGKKDHHQSHHHKQHTHRQTKSDNEDKCPHYSWQQIGKHDHKDDLWVVIQDGVYNLSKFVDKHPGGSKVIAVRAGRKANKAFHHGNHPPRVMDKVLPHYRIGSIKDESMIQSWQRETKTGKMDSFMAIVWAVGILSFIGYMIV